MLLTILDGYVDEPANFGVPPYISPHARYLAGATWSAEPDADVRYLTIDELRAGSPKADLVQDADLLVVVAGALVPGKYLRGRPMTWREARRIVGPREGASLLVGSSALYGFGQGGGKPPAGRDELDAVFTYRGRLHGDALLHDLLEGTTDGRHHQRKRTMAEWREWGVLGAPVVRDHPDHGGDLLAELDTYHGCVRYVNGGCSFCMEPKEGRPEYRPVADVVAEVAALARQGVRDYRLGGQACFYSYHARGLGETPTPEPNPQAIETLLRGIHGAAPDLRTLHLDNVDPAVVAANPDASAEVTKLIVRYMTDGNIAAFGVESADPAVKEAVNLNADPETVLEAAAILNRYGAERGPTGHPRFLPGLNFIAGLPGETAATYDHDRAFLEAYLERGLLARRINLRKLVVDGREAPHVDQHRFLSFKRWLREEVDRPLLQRMYPPGTRLRDVRFEARDGKTTFGRRPGTYALLVGVPYEVPLGAWSDVVVTGHGYRSLTGVAVPFDVNGASLRALRALPGVGRKRAGRLAVARPLRGAGDVEAALDDPDLGAELAPLLTFA